jgi:hypothetical protein
MGEPHDADAVTAMTRRLPVMEKHPASHEFSRLRNDIGSG